METFELHILELMHFPFGVVVVGRCGEAGFAVGEVFTELRWSRAERIGSPVFSDGPTEGIAVEVRLRVEQISAYDRLHERLYSGLSAGLSFTGPGLEALTKIDVDADLRAGKSWSLRGQRLAEAPAARFGSD